MTSDVDTTAVEVPADDNGHASREIVPAAPPTLAVTPQVKATELVARLDTISEAADKAMTEGVDYGNVPGTDKPTLFKPGAEKLSVLFQLDVQLVNEKKWGPGDHLTVLSRATVYHAPSGARLGYGEGLCSTRERKYAYRKQERTCPACGAAAVIKGKAEYGGGWLCWKRRDGCGAKFNDGDPQIEGQPTGEIDNPDLPDLWNTVVKMAEKRARVDAVLAVTGASAIFTQDIEDSQPAPEPPPTEPAPSPVPRQELSNETVDDLAAMARAGIDAGDIDGQRLKLRLVDLGATTTSNLRASIASLPAAAEAPLRAELTPPTPPANGAPA